MHILMSSKRLGTIFKPEELGPADKKKKKKMVPVLLNYNSDAVIGLFDFGGVL